ncbi:50S ribosomal protein L11 methyltransferase [Sphingomonas rubra]|nr:50S ribosomal protein L11 methyltransferase [Sphingomonas rubra]
MSADVGGGPAGSWKVTLPCTRAEAEAIDAGPELPLDPAPTLATSEEVLDDAEAWRLDAYFAQQPSAHAIAAIAALAPSAGAAPLVERLADEDWVTISQAGLAPLHVGRFFVHAGDETPPAGTRALRIAAGRAFGTGHHETTSGCLAMLDALERDGAAFASVVDIGTGTGLLAFAAAYLWPGAAIVATDIDPVAVDVTRENAAANGVEGIALVVADGTLDPAVVGPAPYELVIANILAGPLVSMAPELAAIAAPGATIVLAGLLETQRAAVVAAYQACGCALAEVDRRGDWSVLRLTAGAERFVPSGPFDPKGRDGWALDL